MKKKRCCTPDCTLYAECADREAMEKKQKAQTTKNKTKED